MTHGQKVSAGGFLLLLYLVSLSLYHVASCFIFMVIFPLSYVLIQFSCVLASLHFQTV